jgi:hypothetical protein
MASRKLFEEGALDLDLWRRNNHEIVSDRIDLDRRGEKQKRVDKNRR